MSSPGLAGRPARFPWPLLYAALALVWGASFLFMKLGLRSLAPVQISTLRIVLGAAVLTLLAATSRTRLPRDTGTWAHLQVSGLFLASLPFTLFALAETRVSSALAGVGNATTPIATVLLSWLALRGHERLAGTTLVAVLLGFLGVLVIFEPWAQSAPDPLGFGMTVAAGASYGVGWTYNRRFLGHRDLGGLAQPTAQLLVAAGQMVLVVLVWWATQRGRLAAPWTPGAEHPHDLPLALLGVVALGVLGTGLAFAAQFEVVRQAGVTVNATVTYLIPVVSVVLGATLLGERLGPAQLAGGAIVLVAAVLVQVNGWRSARSARAARLP